jgi:hypothetical protein
LVKGKELPVLMENGGILFFWKDEALSLFRYFVNLVLPRMWQYMNNPR